MTMGSERIHRLLAGATLLVLVGAGVPMLLTWRTPPQPAAPAAPDAAAAIVVDLKESATPADVARLEQESGLDLQENSIEYPVDHVMRAGVPPAQQAAALTALRADPVVEFAEPEVRFRIPEGEAAGPPMSTVLRAALKAGQNGRWTP